MTDKTPESSRPPVGQRTTLMITIWSALAGESDVVWRGIVETGDGHRHYFHTPDGLLQLLAQLCDWPDIAT